MRIIGVHQIAAEQAPPLPLIDLVSLENQRILKELQDDEQQGKREYGL